MASKITSEHLLSPIVEVKVGEGSEKQLYHLHSSLLCEVSGYFRGCFGGRFTEAASRKTALLDVNVTAFAAFVKWAYSGELAPSRMESSTWDSPGTIAELQQNLVDLYVTGDRLICSGLKNRAVDIMQATHTAGNVSIACFIRLVHAGLAESKMAAYLVAQLAYDVTVNAKSRVYMGDARWSEFLTADGNLTSKLLEGMLESERAQVEYREERHRLLSQRLAAEQLLARLRVPPPPRSRTAQQVQQVSQARPLAMQEERARRLQQMMQARPQSPQDVEGCRWHEHDDGKDHGCKRWPETGDAFAFAGLRK